MNLDLIALEVPSKAPNDSAPRSAAPTQVSKETTFGQPQAILVIHGIGKQQPFQPLDSFVNGLRAMLWREGKKVTIKHLLFGKEMVFEHCIRVEASEVSDKPPNLQLDVYEFYWSPLTRGKASFSKVVRWLVATGLTPVRRFAFNIPLIVGRGASLGQRCREFAHELWRLVYVPLVAVGIAWLAAALVAQSSTLAKQLPDALARALPYLMTWSGGATAAVVAVAAMAAIGVGLSLPEQIRDLWRLWKVKSEIRSEAIRTADRAYKAENKFFIGLVKGAVAGTRHWWKTRRQWQAEFNARLLFLPLSIIGLALAVGVVIWLSLPLLHDLFSRPTTAMELVGVILLLAIAFVLKRVFVDYLGDIALYTTADENSEFFATRVAILEQVIRRIRFLLREYPSVAIAGHSLGSVIAYDAINWLRTEAQAEARKALEELPLRSQALPSERAITAKVDQLEREPTAPITAPELAKLKTLITFGSPLNKVLYFFRTKIKIYEEVRGHIVWELHGFRQLPDLVRQDWQIEDASKPIPDKLYWVNVYSPMDPVSARLVFYSNVQEHRCWYPIWGKCHLDYWHDPDFYRVVLAALQRPDALEAPIDKGADRAE